VIKAWITNLSQDSDTATAVGFYTSCESICTLFASVIAGAIWTNSGAAVTFLSTAGITVLVCLYLIFRSKKKKLA